MLQEYAKKQMQVNQQVLFYISSLGDDDVGIEDGDEHDDEDEGDLLYEGERC